jgi:hypothetical protein
MANLGYPMAGKSPFLGGLPVEHGDIMGYPWLWSAVDWTLFFHSNNLSVKFCCSSWQQRLIKHRKAHNSPFITVYLFKSDWHLVSANERTLALRTIRRRVSSSHLPNSRYISSRWWFLPQKHCSSSAIIPVLDGSWSTTYLTYLALGSPEASRHRRFFCSDSAALFLRNGRRNDTSKGRMWKTPSDRTGTVLGEFWESSGRVLGEIWDSSGTVRELLMVWPRWFFPKPLSCYGHPTMGLDWWPSRNELMGFNGCWWVNLC